AASLRRAARFAEAWAPVNTSPERVRELLQTPAARHHLERREKPIDVILSNMRFDPLGDPDGTRRSFHALGAAGVTGVVPRIPSSSAQHLIEQHHALLAATRDVPAPSR